MSGQNPEGYVQGCQLSIHGRGPQVVKSLPRWQTLRKLETCNQEPSFWQQCHSQLGLTGWRIFIQKDVLQLCLD